MISAGVAADGGDADRDHGDECGDEGDAGHRRDQSDPPGAVGSVGGAVEECGGKCRGEEGDLEGEPDGEGEDGGGQGTSSVQA